MSLLPCAHQSDRTPDEDSTRVDEQLLPEWVGYDTQTDSYVFTVEWGGKTSVSTQILLALEEIIETESWSQPLYQTIDPDALDTLFAPQSNADRESGTVSFTVAEHTVRVQGSGTVVIRPV